MLYIRICVLLYVCSAVYETRTYGAMRGARGVIPYIYSIHTKMEQAVHIAMMEPYNISADWNMGSPTSERLPTWQGKVGRE